MDKAVERFRERRSRRLSGRVRKDDEENNLNQPRNTNHGNTKLPFGLCRKYGIEIGSDWSPRDAWGALAGKGITPGGEFARLSEGKKPVTTIKSGSDTTYSNLTSKKGKDRFGRYYLYGDMEMLMKGREPYRSSQAQIASFINKEEMMAYLQEKGVTRFKDPDSGEMVNPVKMELPRTVAKVGEKRYTDLVLGMVRSVSGPFSGWGYTITGKDFGGEKMRLKTFRSVAAARKYAEAIGCDPKDLRESREFKKYAKDKE